MAMIVRWMMVVMLAAAVAPTGVGVGIIAPAAGQVNLPHAIGSDNAGNQWMLYHQGQLRQQGNMPLYSQGARLTINGANLNVRHPQARLNAETNELILDGMQAGTLEVERRVRAMEGGYVRYIDVIRNPTAADVTVQIQLQTNVNYGVQSSQQVNDPRDKSGPIAWVAQTSANRAVVEVFAGQKAPVKPTLNSPQGSNVIAANLSVTVPRNDSIALVHLHATADSAQEGQQWVLQLREQDILGDVPSDLRRRIVNFRRGGFDIGEYEILRGDVFDVIELHGGDQFRGTLRQDGYRITTFYGEVDLPVNRVIGLINVGQIRPRQLIITRDGEVFGGMLQAQTIALELSTGQQIQVPLSQISRIGYRKQADEPEEWTFDQPLVLMRQGDRVMVQPPTAPIEVITRYGRLMLEPSAIAAITFQNEEHGVHEVILRDGSRFAGLVTAEDFEMELKEGNQLVRFSTASLLRFQMVLPPEEPHPDSGIFTAVTGDVLVGALGGELRFDTAFDTITINGREIKRLANIPEQSTGIQVVMWDNTSFSGHLHEEMLQLDLASGLQVSVPVSLLATYEHPLPHPSGAVRRRIETIVADLDADDWRQRDRAQAQLVSMGVAVIGVLEELRPSQSPEAQQRIDQVIQELKNQQER